MSFSLNKYLKFIKECLKKHEVECEEAFAIQRSQDKSCGICLEIVWDRNDDNRFGLLENCDHIFCLECIRKWRSSSDYEYKIVKAWLETISTTNLNKKKACILISVQNVEQNRTLLHQRNIGQKIIKLKKI